MPVNPPTPTRGLLIGLGATLLVVAIFSLSSLRQVHGLRQLQADTIERNRRDSLQLIRIQNVLNNLGLAMRDMIEDRDGYGIAAWKGQFARHREDLADAIQVEGKYSTRRVEERQQLTAAIDQFWTPVDQVFATSDPARARALVANSLQAQQASLTTTVAQLLIENNEAETQAAREIRDTYDRVDRNTYLFLVAMLAGTTAIGLVVAHHNRRLFDRVAELSQQRSTLARGLIGVQEEVFRSVARELHDDFGQILTAVSVMLKRAEKKGLPPDSPLREDMAEIRTVTQEALEKTRSVSQALHPTILDDYGLCRALERHIQVFDKQTGLATTLECGDVALAPDRAIHVYRVVQEALTNVARHARATEASVRIAERSGTLVLEVRDNGQGIPAKPVPGLGLIAMRERAALLGGNLDVKRGPNCGTLVCLEVPLE